MTRKPRIKLNQAETYYHVMTRTVQQAFFLDESQTPGFKAKCWKIIEDLTSIYYVDVVAFTIMSNHYHLCLSVKKPDFNAQDVEERFKSLQSLNKRSQPWSSTLEQPYYERLCDLSRFMWDLNRRIACTYNYLKKTKGHFWGGRFVSKVIEDEEAALRVMAYIEQNAVRAGLCQYPSEFEWSSAGRARRYLEKGEMVQIPAIGFLRNFEAEDRTKAYILWMDHQADLILRPEKQSEPTPDWLIKFCLSGRVLENWREEFEEGEPSNWSKQGYGREDFEEKIVEAEKERLAYLAKLRRQFDLASKRGRPRESFESKPSHWHQPKRFVHLNEDP